MSIIFIEPGTDDTHDLSAYNGDTGAGTVDSDTSQAYTGSRSIKLSTGSPAASAILNSIDNILADAGRRFSFKFRTTALPASNTSILQFHVSTGTSFIFGLNLLTNGKLQAAPQGATAVTGTTTLAVNTWYYISVSYTITSTSSFRFDFRVNGNLEGSATAGTLSFTSTSMFKFRANAAHGTSINNFFDDVYIDDTADYSDPGDQRVANGVAFILTPLTQGVSDDANSLLDSGEIFEYGELFWDSAILQLSGYNVLITEDLNSWSDSLALVFSYNYIITEDFNNLLDAIIDNVGYNKDLSDDLNNWLDAVVNGSGILFIDANDDLNSWLDDDGLILGYGILLTDDLNSWLDAFESSPPRTDLTLADTNAANWLDAIITVINLPAEFADDTLNLWLDYIAAGYGIVLTDDLNSWLDSLDVGFELVIVDDIASVGWLDAFASSITVSILTIVAAEDLNNWLDAYSTIYGYQIYPSDSLNLWSDLVSFNIVEFSDDLNYWDDSVNLIYGYTLDIREDLHLWTEDFFSYNFDFSSDAAVFLDNYYRRYLNDVGPVDIASDFLGFIFLQLRDGESDFADALDLFKSEATPLILTTTDDLNNWLDALVIGFIDYYLAVTDDLNNWNDSTNLIYAYLLETNDDLNNWLDSIDFLYNLGLVTTDDLNNWLDDIILAMVIGLAVADDGSANWLDAFATTVVGEQTIVATDDLNVWLDAITFIYLYGLVLTDDGSANWGN